MWSDEVRLDLRHAVHKAWAPRRVAVTRTVPINWSYTDVAVGFEPLTRRLWWAWQAHSKNEARTRTWGAWAEDPDVADWVWDGTGGPRGRDMQALAVAQVVPPYAPELNPAARLF